VVNSMANASTGLTRAVSMVQPPTLYCQPKYPISA
jgi:hypothetical protein